MACDRFSFCWALFKDPRCEGVPQIMNAGRPFAIRRNTSKLPDSMESVFYGSRVNPQVAGRQKQMVIRRRQVAPMLEVALERSCRRRVEWNEAALAEFRFADLQHLIGQNVVKSEVERL